MRLDDARAEIQTETISTAVTARRVHEVLKQHPEQCFVRSNIQCVGRVRQYHSGCCVIEAFHDAAHHGGRTEAIAGRNFSMTFGIQSAHDDNLLVELSAIRGSYSAHGMNQRLPTSHLTGNEFPLQGDGHSFTAAESDTPPAEVNLGQITDGGLRPSESLAELLPVLPGAPVSVGSTWDTERYTRSLEGWAWAGGMLKRHHEVGSIDQSNGRTVVSVRSLGTAILGAAEGNTGFVGEGTLKQTIDWTFDANSGQLLSLTIEQEASGGASQLPQGAVPVRQISRYELSALE